MPTGAPLVNSNQILVGLTGLVAVAPVGTSPPTTTSGALNGAFKELGYLSEDGFTFTESKDIADINVWQSFYPARKLITGRNVQVEFVMKEWFDDSLSFALGGATVTSAHPNHTVTPPLPANVDYRSLVIEWVDGTRYYRLYFPKGLAVAEISSQFTRSDSAGIPITFAGVDPGTGTNIYTLFTNDVAFSS